MAKTPEQEEQLSEFEAERFEECWRIILGDKFDEFVSTIKHFIDKYGEEEFVREWKKAMKQSKKK